MAHDAAADSAWKLQIFEDVQMPGWLFLPAGLEPPEQAEWLARAVAELSYLIGAEKWDGQPTSEADVRELLLAGLADRTASDAVAMFQVWPVLGPAAVTCYVNVFASAAMPDWGTATDAVVHLAEGAHLGPGLQCSTRRTVADESGRADLASVQFVFDNGEATLMISLEESVPALVARALPGLVQLKDVLGMSRASDGERFVAVEPVGILEDPPWQLDHTA